MNLEGKVAIVGAGRVGTALAVVLQRTGYVVSGVASQTEQSAARLGSRLGCAWSTAAVEVCQKADVVFITTPDRCIEKTAQQVAQQGGWRAGQYVYHVCGSQTAAVLLAAEQAGASIGSMHPLQAFSGVEEATASLPGSYFALDGSEAAVKKAQEIVTAIGGCYFMIAPENRALYHAAACMASNYMVAILHSAVQMFKSMGISEETALAALKPLLKGTVENICTKGTEQALTGPIGRGDVMTIEKHLAKITELSPKESTIYGQLGIYTQRIAEKQHSVEAQDSQKLSTVLQKFIHNC